MFKRLVDVLRFRPLLIRWLAWRMRRLSSSATNKLLLVLLKAMQLAFIIYPDFRQNIVDFRATYVLRSRDGAIHRVAEFRDSRLELAEQTSGQVNASLTFKNSKALADFLFSERPDLLGAMLRQEVTPEGNLNYLYRLAYMANHLRLRFMPSR